MNREEIATRLKKCYEKHQCSEVAACFIPLDKLDEHMFSIVSFIESEIEKVKKKIAHRLYDAVFGSGMENAYENSYKYLKGFVNKLIKELEDSE